MRPLRTTAAAPGCMGVLPDDGRSGTLRIIEGESHRALTHSGLPRPTPYPVPSERITVTVIPPASHLKRCVDMVDASFRSACSNPSLTGLGSGGEFSRNHISGSG